MVKYTRKNYRGGGSSRSERRKCRKYKDTKSCNKDRSCAWCNTGCNGRECPRCMKIDNVMSGKHCLNKGDQNEARRKYTYSPYVKPGSKSKSGSRKRSLSKVFQKKTRSQLIKEAEEAYGIPGIKPSNRAYNFNPPPDKSVVEQWKKETMPQSKAKISKPMMVQTIYDSEGDELKVPLNIRTARELMKKMKLPTIRSSALGKLRKNTKRKKKPKKKKQPRRRNQTKRLR